MHETNKTEKKLVHQRTATPEECAQALQQLSDTDWRRLDELASFRAMGLKQVEGWDLLHEAIVRMLEGKRKWPLNIPLVIFLRETMRSIASDLWRRRQDATEVAETDTRAYREDGEGLISRTADSSEDLEAKAIAEQELARIDDLFKNDKRALAVITGKISGMSPEEIQRQAKLSETQYATTLRRIRRRMNKLSEDMERE